MAANDQILQLQVTLKGRTLRTYRFQRETVRVGRNPKADIPLDNPSISWEHAVLERNPAGAFRVSDLESANGTFLNGERVRKAFLRDGDILSFGKFNVHVTFDEDRRQRDGPFSQKTTEAEVEPVDPTYALTTGELKHMLATGLAQPLENESIELHVVSELPAPELDQRHILWAYVLHVLQAERGPVLVAFALGLLVGTFLTRCVS